MRVFLDANILSSAAKSDGAIRLLLRNLGTSGHQLVADAYVWEEARRNISIRDPSALEELEKISATVKIDAVYNISEAAVAKLPVVDKDKPVLASAIKQNCNVLLTGDRTHFGKLYDTTVEGVAIISPKQAAQSLLGPRERSSS